MGSANHHLSCEMWAGLHTRSVNHAIDLRRNSELFEPYCRYENETKAENVLNYTRYNF